MGEKQRGWCRKCGWTGPLRPLGAHRRPQDGQQCNYAATPTDTKPAGEGEAS